MSPIPTRGPGDAFRLELFRDFLAFERGLSARTVEAYLRDARRLVEYLEARGVARPEDVDPRDLRDWIFHLKDGGRAATTIRRAQSSIRALFAYHLAEGRLEDDPTERLESPRVGRRLPDVLSRDEVDRLLEAPDPDHGLYARDRAVLEVLYASGLRVSELVELGLTRLDLEAGVALVLGKGSKERLVPVGRPACRAVTRYLRDLRPRLEAGRGRGEGRVFLTARGRPLSRMAVWTVVRKAADRAGIHRKVSPHTLRHTFATHLLEGGAELTDVQELLGHADISTTQIYTHLDRDYLVEVHRKYHPRG